MKHPVKCMYRGIPLRRFSLKELHGYMIAIETMVKLDLVALKWREMTGKGINISPVEGGILREKKGNSQHDWETWGETRALDIFPGVTNFEEAEDFYNLCVREGFTGIGIYPDAEPSVMFHVDTRHDEEPLNPATWGALRSEDPNKTWDYVSLTEAMEKLE